MPTNAKSDAKQSADNLGMDRFLRMPDVERVTSLKRGYLYRLIAAGSFPRPYKLAARASAWRASEVRSWMDARSRADRVEVA